MTEGQILKKYKRFFWGKGNLVSCFGLECDDGWFPMILNLLESISKEKPPKDFCIFQIKEKFGGLRMYAGKTTEKIKKLIDNAEEKSFKTCEWCGKAGKMRKKEFWLKTLCDKDYISWKNYERKGEVGSTQITGSAIEVRKRPTSVTRKSLAR